ncbi:hypothetical protein LR48_Vigan01g103500 [Vigna angularis]|uniref:NAC domain-containing protein n=1 Tax=Phaseolus angularis TaxID=3914 RepID=A0A0L9TLR4_PHAAN|nr:hypothetical protein LR48_Vigan01g103500 [Vigna angularis]
MGVNENFNNNHDHHGCVDDDEIPLPGFRFHPTDEDLVSFYLQRKLHKKPISIDLINQIDIYKYDPWDLPSGFSHAPDNLTYGVDMKQIRWCGILKRIALAYLVVALVEIFSRSAQDRSTHPTLNIEVVLLALVSP